MPVSPLVMAGEPKAPIKCLAGSRSPQFADFTSAYLEAPVTGVIVKYFPNKGSRNHRFSIFDQNGLKWNRRAPHGRVD